MLNNLSSNSRVNYIVDKKIRNILKAHSCKHNPVYIINNGYVFDYKDQYLNALMTETVTINDLADEVIITGFNWYIKGWKFIEGKYDIGIKKQFLSDNKKIKFLFKDSILPSSIDFCSHCGSPFSIDFLYPDRESRMKNKKTCEACSESNSFYSDFEKDTDNPYNSDGGYDI